MKNLVFMLWVILWPFCSHICDFLSFKMGKPYEEIKKLNEKTALIMVAIWIIIAVLLYEK